MSEGNQMFPWFNNSWWFPWLQPSITIFAPQVSVQYSPSLAPTTTFSPTFAPVTRTDTQTETGEFEERSLSAIDLAKVGTLFGQMRTSVENGQSNVFYIAVHGEYKDNQIEECVRRFNDDKNGWNISYSKSSRMVRFERLQMGQ